MDNSKLLKIEAQKMRLEEETKTKVCALLSTVNKTNRALEKERPGNNGQNNSNLIPA